MSLRFSPRGVVKSIVLSFGSLYTRYTTSCIIVGVQKGTMISITPQNTCCIYIFFYTG